MLEDYAEQRPSGRLHPFIHRMAHAHFTQGLPPERLAPDSYIKLSFIFSGDPQYYTGENERLPWRDGFIGHISPGKGIATTSGGAVRCLMANFFPTAYHLLFGGDLRDLNDRMVPIREVLGTADEEALYVVLRNAATPVEMFASLEDYFLKRLETTEPDAEDPMLALEHAMRADRGKKPVSELAEQIGISVRQLERRFLERVGLTPKAFSGVLRFNHAYALMRSKATLDLDTALACGYYDESHMMKDLAFYLGDAPKRFVHLHRPMVDMNLGH